MKENKLKILQSWLKKRGKIYTLKELKELKNLSLCGNKKIRSIPKEISELKNLINLDLGYNNLTSFPLEIGKLKNLEYLHLDRNKLNSLPPEMKKLKGLISLNLRGNNFEFVYEGCEFINKKWGYNFKILPNNEATRLLYEKI